MAAPRRARTRLHTNHEERIFSPAPTSWLGGGDVHAPLWWNHECPPLFRIGPGRGRLTDGHRTCMGNTWEVEGQVWDVSRTNLITCSEWNQVQMATSSMGDPNRKPRIGWSRDQDVDVRCTSERTLKPINCGNMLAPLPDTQELSSLPSFQRGAFLVGTGSVQTLPHS